MEFYNVNNYGHEYRVCLFITKYMSNDTLALVMHTDEGEPFCNLTTNIADSDTLCGNTMAFVDTNNCPWAEDFIAENKLGVPTGIYGQSGFCTYPLYKFDIEKILKSSSKIT